MMADWIIVVDDDVTNLKMAGHILSNANMRVTALKSGRALLDYVSEKGTPDLILLDIMMPEVDGFEVLKVLRSNPMTADIRIIILSALNSAEDVVRGYNLGANDFITKPIILEKLINSVSTQLQIVDLSRLR